MNWRTATRSFLATGGFLLLATLPACDHITKVTRTVQLESMPGRACVVRSLGEFQKTENVSLGESGPPDARPLVPEAGEQGAWPASFRISSLVPREYVWFDVNVQETAEGAELVMQFNDFGPNHSRSEVDRAIRQMRKLESLVLQICQVKAKSPARETCSIDPEVNCRT